MIVIILTKIHVSILSGVNLCYLEDFIETNTGENVFILLDKSKEIPFSELTEITAPNKTDVQLGYGNKYTYICRKESIFPNRQSTIDGICKSNL